MSLLSLQFSKTGNLFEISIWYCFLTSSSFSFLKIKFFQSNFSAAYLLTANHSLTFASSRQWSVSQSPPLKLLTSSILESHLLSINTWSIWLWFFPSARSRFTHECFGAGTSCSSLLDFLMWECFIPAPLPLLSCKSSHSQLSVWKYFLSPLLH